MAIFTKNGVVAPKVLTLSGKTIINPTEEEYLSAGYSKLTTKSEETPSFEEVKETVIQRIKNFDTSDEVNSFFINGEKTWFDKVTRLGLINSVNVEIASHRQTINIWVNNKSFEINCNTMLQLLSSLEHYAMECYKTTASHLAEIETIDDIVVLENYDYMYGYPERLEFTV